MSAETSSFLLSKCRAHFKMLSPRCFPSFPFLEWVEGCRIVELERDSFHPHELSREKVRHQTKAPPSHKTVLPWAWGGEQRMFSSFSHSLLSNGTMAPATTECPLMCERHIQKAAAGKSRDDAAWAADEKQRGEGHRYLMQRALCEFSVSLALCFVLSRPRILNLSASDFVSWMVLSYE